MDGALYHSPAWEAQPEKQNGSQPLPPLPENASEEERLRYELAQARKFPGGSFITDAFIEGQIERLKQNRAAPSVSE